MAQELKRLNSFGNYDQFGGYYDADEADAVLAEKDKEITQLKDKLQAAEKQTENLINSASSLMLKQDTANDKLDAEIAELKQKLESVQASMYADVVDANMDNRRLKRALWIARAQAAYRFVMFWASHFEEHPELRHIGYTVKCRALFSPHKLRFPDEWLRVWKEVESKCRAKAKEYK